MKYSYPYKSRLKSQLQSKRLDIEYRVWEQASLQNLVERIQKPIIEIGGPTQDGYYFLDSVPLNTKIIITNISPTPLRLSPDSSELAGQVEELLDATSMPYEDNSVGAFPMAAMSISSDWWVNLPDEEIVEVSPKFEREFANAQLEMGWVAAGIQAPEAVQDAQRVKIYLEVARCLEAGGLLFTDGAMEDISILKQLRFEIVACLQITEGHQACYEFVAVKRS